jgi:hypothetical protein
VKQLKSELPFYKILNILLPKNINENDNIISTTTF